MNHVSLKVQHTHVGEGNVECDPIEELECSSGFVYQCRKCGTEIVVLLEKEA